MIKKIILKWLNKIHHRIEDDYRIANIANILEDEDKKLMKKYRNIMKNLNKRNIS